jgi:hypothetical protein
VEKTLADCILRENAALGKLYKFEATEAKKKLEDTNIDIGFVCHSIQKSSITLYEDTNPRKCHRESASQVDGNVLRPEGDLTQAPGTRTQFLFISPLPLTQFFLLLLAGATPSVTFECEAAALDLESVY